MSALVGGVAAVGVAAAVCCFRSQKKSKRRKMPPLTAPEGGLSVVTWNISAINNNPFEYFISHDDAGYAKLMAGTEQFVENPGELDVPVHAVLTDTMFADLKALMNDASIQEIDTVEQLWKDDFRNRKIVTGFLKDSSIGSKRLCSMPDRLTNTIRLGSDTSSCRPTIINNYIGSLSTLDEWWSRWTSWMFKDPLQQEKGKVVKPYELISKLSRAKYPAVTESEEKVSVPLQLLCLAIFDAIMVHIMVTLSPDGSWQQIKRSIVDAIFRYKDENTVAVLENACADADIICLQECASFFTDKLVDTLGDQYHVVLPKERNLKRDQNSALLLRKKAFPQGTDAELTDKALSRLKDAGCDAVAVGDLCAFSAKHASGKNFLLASFHGDTNGLATEPILKAIMQTLESCPQGTEPVIGLDANCYVKKKDGFLHIDDFLQVCAKHGLRTMWPDGSKAEDNLTTCIARTYLQPQLNKSLKMDDRFSKGDLNPKDHILFKRESFEVDSYFKDNTGQHRFVERECFPSLSFPSDHGIVAAMLRGVSKQAANRV